MKDVMKELEYNMFMHGLLFNILKKPEKLKPYDTKVEVDKPGYYLFYYPKGSRMGKVTLITERYFALETTEGHIFYDRKFQFALEYMGPLENEKKTKKPKKKIKQ